MSDSYILLTGATGGTGAVILEKLLEAGYSVNAVLRSFAKAKAGLSEQYGEAVGLGRLKFTEIPDMAVKDAFHEAARGASAIIHAATPITDKNWEEDFIKPTWAHLDNVLNAAAASGTVKRVVITGSIVSVFRLPEGLLSGKTFSESDFNDIPREAAQSVVTAYQYSKVTSEQRAWAYVEREKPEFDVVYLLAPAIIGKNIQMGFKPDKTSIGGVGMTYRELFDREQPGFLFPYYMDVEDVATIHVKALDKSVPGGKRYLFRGPGLLTAAAAANEIRRALPELQKRVPAGDEAATSQAKIAQIVTTNFENTFGTGWKSWEGAVLAVAKDILKREGPDAVGTKVVAGNNYEISA